MGGTGVLNTGVLDGAGEVGVREGLGVNIGLGVLIGSGVLVFEGINVGGI